MNFFASQIKRMLVLFLLFVSCVDATLPVIANEITGSGEVLVKDANGNYGAYVNSMTNGASINTDGMNAQVRIVGSGSTLTWQYLNVASGQWLDFHFTGANQIAVNNVVENMSAFAGKLTSSGDAGRIIISNPNGILFENGSYTSANALTLTTQGVKLEEGMIKLLGDSSNGKIQIGTAGSKAVYMNIADDLNIISNGIKITDSDLLAGNNIRLITADGVNFLATTGEVVGGSVVNSNNNAQLSAATNNAGDVIQTSILVKDSALAVKNKDNGRIYFIAKGDSDNANVAAIDSVIDGVIDLDVAGTADLELIGNLVVRDSYVAKDLITKTLNKSLSLSNSASVTEEQMITIGHYLVDTYGTDLYDANEVKSDLAKVFSGYGADEIALMATKLNSVYKIVTTTTNNGTLTAVSGKGGISIKNTIVGGKAIVDGAGVEIDGLTAASLDAKSTTSSGTSYLRKEGEVKSETTKTYNWKTSAWDEKKVYTGTTHIEGGTRMYNEVYVVVGSHTEQESYWFFGWHTRTITVDDYGWVPVKLVDWKFLDGHLGKYWVDVNGKPIADKWETNIGSVDIKDIPGGKIVGGTEVADYNLEKVAKTGDFSQKTEDTKILKDSSTTLNEAFNPLTLAVGELALSNITLKTGETTTAANTLTADAVGKLSLTNVSAGNTTLITSGDIQTLNAGVSGDLTAVTSKNIILNNTSANSLVAGADKDALTKSTKIALNGGSSFKTAKAFAADVDLNDSSLIAGGLIEASNNINLNSGSYIIGNVATGSVPKVKTGNSLIMSGNSFITNSELNVGKDLTMTNSGIYATTANVGGSVKATNSSIVGSTVEADTISVNGNDLNNTATSTLSASTLNSQRGVSIDNLSADGLITATAQNGDVSLSNVTGNSSLEFSTIKSGNVSVNGSTTGSEKINSAGGVTLSSVIAKGDVVAESTGDILINGLSTKATKSESGNVSTETKGNITVSDSNIAGNLSAESLVADSKTGALNWLGNGTLTSSSSRGDVKVNSTSVSGNVSAVANNVEVNGGSAGSYNLTAKADSTTSSKYVLGINTSESKSLSGGDVTVSGAVANSNEGSVLNADNKITISNNSKFKTIKAFAADIDIKDSTTGLTELTAEKSINVDNAIMGDVKAVAKNAGKISISNSQANSLNLESQKATNLYSLGKGFDSINEAVDILGLSIYETGRGDIIVTNTDVLNGVDILANNIEVNGGTLGSLTATAENKTLSFSKYVNFIDSENTGKVLIDGVITTKGNIEAYADNIKIKNANSANDILANKLTIDFDGLINGFRFDLSDIDSLSGLTGLLSLGSGNTVEISNSDAKNNITAYGKDITMTDVNAGNSINSVNTYVGLSSVVDSSVLNKVASVFGNSKFITKLLGTDSEHRNTITRATAKNINTLSFGNVTVADSTADRLVGLASDVDVSKTTANKAVLVSANDIDIKNNSNIGSGVSIALDNINVDKSNVASSVILAGGTVSAINKSEISKSAIIAGKDVSVTDSKLKNVISIAGGDFNSKGSELKNVATKSTNATLDKTVADNAIIYADKTISVKNNSRVSDTIAISKDITVVDSRVKTSALLAKDDVTVTNSIVKASAVSAGNDIKLSGTKVKTSALVAGNNVNAESDSKLAKSVIAAKGNVSLDKSEADTTMILAGGTVSAINKSEISKSAIIAGKDVSVTDSTLKNSFVKSSNIQIQKSKIANVSLNANNDISITRSEARGILDAKAKGDISVDKVRGNAKANLSATDVDVNSTALGDTVIDAKGEVNVSSSLMKSADIIAVGDVNVSDSLVRNNMSLSTDNDATLKGVFVGKDLSISKAKNVLITNSGSVSPAGYPTIASLLNGEKQITDYNKSRFNDSYFDTMSVPYGTAFGEGARISYVGGSMNISNVNNVDIINTAIVGNLNEGNIANDATLIHSFVGGDYEPERSTIGRDASVYESYIKGKYTDFYPDAEDDFSNLDDVNKLRYGSPLDVAFRQQFNPRGFAASSDEIQMMKKSTLSSLSKGSANSFKFSKGFVAY